MPGLLLVPTVDRDRARDVVDELESHPNVILRCFFVLARHGL